MGNLFTTENENNSFIDAGKFAKTEDEVQQDRQPEKELRQAERPYNRQQAAEQGRRDKKAAADTRKRELLRHQNGTLK